MMPDSYFTLIDTTDVETKIQRSRFIAVAAPAQDEQKARGIVAEIGKKYHDSRHVCHGWHLGLPPDAVENRNDDGEPSGTAGEPILMAIRRSGLTDLVVVVVRYFGGIKLGTGGLSRAYGGAADLVLASAPRREVLLGREFDLTLPYSTSKTLHHLLEMHRGRIVQESFASEITARLWLPHSTSLGFLKALKEASAGQLFPVAVDGEEKK